MVKLGEYVVYHLPGLGAAGLLLELVYVGPSLVAFEECDVPGAGYQFLVLFVHFLVVFLKSRPYPRGRGGMSSIHINNLWENTGASGMSNPAPLFRALLRRDCNLNSCTAVSTRTSVCFGQLISLDKGHLRYRHYNKLCDSFAHVIGVWNAICR